MNFQGRLLKKHVISGTYTDEKIMQIWIGTLQTEKPFTIRIWESLGLHLGRGWDGLGPHLAALGPLLRDFWWFFGRSKYIFFQAWAQGGL